MRLRGAVTGAMEIRVWFVWIFMLETGAAVAIPVNISSCKPKLIYPNLRLGSPYHTVSGASIAHWPH